MSKLTLIACILNPFALSTLLNAQDFNTQLHYIESLAEDLNTEELVDIWEYYAQNPINISNPSQIHLLQNLTLLKPEEINLITEFGNKHKIYAIYQLQVLDIQISSLKRIKPFISANSKKEENSKKQTSLYMGIQLQSPQKNGILQKTYIGSPWKTQIKIRSLIKNHWKIGVNLEKDYGEPIVYKDQGINNLAFNLIYKGRKKLNQVTLGRYDITIGEGLLFGTSYRINSPYFLTFTPGETTKPRLSPKEYNYFEGVTAKWKFKYLTADIFSSYRKPHGAISYDQTGLFRSSTELKKYKNHTEQLIGIHLSKEVKQNRFTWATIVYKSKLLQEKPYLLQSYYFRKNYYNITASSEVSNQNYAYWAGILKLNIAVGNTSFITLQFRNRDFRLINEFNADYNSFSNGYEKGIYTAFQHQLDEQWKTKHAVDFFKSTLLKNTYPHYPKGTKICSELSKTTELTKFVSQYQFKQIVNSSAIQKLRLFYQHELNTLVRCSSKLDCITEKRLLNSSLQMNLHLVSKNELWKTRLSTCFFNTKNEAIYWQAPHFYGVYNARLLSGKGSIYSLGIQKRNQQKLKLGLQVVFLNYIDREVINSGNDMINSPSKSEFTAYLKWQN